MCCVYLTACVPFHTLLISVFDHLSDLLNERLPLALQDELTLDLQTQTHTSESDLDMYLDV